MKFENKTKEAIKVEVPNKNPKGWATVRPNETIEAMGSTFEEYYRQMGLSVVGEKAQAKVEIEEPTTEEEKGVQETVKKIIRKRKKKTETE